MSKRPATAHQPREIVRTTPLMRIGRAISDRPAILAYLMNLPMLAAITIVSILPILYSFWISLHDYNLRRPPVRFVGLQNYSRVLLSAEFWQSMRVTFTFTLGSVLIKVIAVTLLALFLNRKFVGRGILRSTMLLPWAIPGVVTAVMWSWIFNPRFGVLNGMLYTLGIIDKYQYWLMTPGGAMGALIFVSVWSGLPFSTLMMLAALQGIPQELYEQATVDRAGVWQRFLHITLPWLSQPLMIILILSTMSGLTVYSLVYVLTGGGPGDATEVVTYAARKKAFDALDFGAANTYAYILALMVLLIGFAYIKVLYKRGDIER